MGRPASAAVHHGVEVLSRSQARVPAAEPGHREKQLSSKRGYGEGGPCRISHG